MKYYHACHDFSYGRRSVQQDSGGRAETQDVKHQARDPTAWTIKDVERSGVTIFSQTHLRRSCVVCRGDPYGFAPAMLWQNQRELQANHRNLLERLSPTPSPLSSRHRPVVFHSSSSKPFSPPVHLQLQQNVSYFPPRSSLSSRRISCPAPKS